MGVTRTVAAGAIAVALAVPGGIDVTDYGGCRCGTSER